MTENNDFNNTENDSTISGNEKRFIKGYHTIRDTYENKTYDFRVDIICNLLNELDEKWIAEFSLRETLQQELQRVEEENKNLKQDKTNLHRAMSRDRVRYLNENEQLKQQMQRLYNYFADWFDDRVPPSDFSEMWDFVKKDEKWD